MPPKSTFFSPKLRTGLVFRDLALRDQRLVADQPVRELQAEIAVAAVAGDDAGDVRAVAVVVHRVGVVVEEVVAALVVAEELGVEIFPGFAAAEILFMLILAVTLVQYWTVTRRQDA